MRIQTAAYVRDLPTVKHTGLFGAVWHRRNAQLGGYDDSVFIDRESFVSEGASWNIALFDGDLVIWPNAEVLPGVTMRTSLLACATGAGRFAESGPLTEYPDGLIRNLTNLPEPRRTRDSLNRRQQRTILCIILLLASGS